MFAISIGGGRGTRWWLKTAEAIGSTGQGQSYGWDERNRTGRAGLGWNGIVRVEGCLCFVALWLLAFVLRLMVSRFALTPVTDVAAAIQCYA